MLKAVLFDLDGTLIDSTQSIMNSFAHAFETVGISAPSYDTIYKTISQRLEEQFETLSDHDPDEMCAIFRSHYFATSTEHTVLLPGVIDTLNTLREAGLRMAVGTSKIHQGAEILLKHLGVMDYFDCIVGGDDVQHPKPNPEVISHLLEHFKLDTDEVLFIGDTEYDTEAAYRAGVDCLAVATGYATREELEESTADAVFDTMNQATTHIMDNIYTH